MSKFLLVPVQLEALYLAKATPVREGFADFTALPYTDGQQDYNPDVAYLSEEVLTPPFQDENLILPAGLHLHWYLPGALTKSKAFGDSNKLPAAPDRWLVTRYRQGKLEKNWLIESDFLAEDAVDNGMVRCHVPYYDGNPSSPNKPYRFLGRVAELASSWQRATAPGSRVEYLTAIGYEPQPADAQASATITGYGEPTFAAFYPHCSSVFGFYDHEITAAPAGDLSYQVLGFYARPGNDYLTQFIANFTQAQAGQPCSPQQFNALLQQAIGEQLLWDVQFDSATLADAPAKVPALADVALPSQSLFCAKIDLNSRPFADPSTVDYRVAVGNTGTEALAAFLGTKLAEAKQGDKTLVETQLEAVQLADKLNNRALDVGAKFREARHEKGFSSLPGETHWAVTVRSATSQATTTDDDVLVEDIVSAHDVQVLNALQLGYERARLDLETAQQHLFAGWSKYMLCAYPPADSLDAYPAIDEAKNFVEQQLAATEQNLAATGTLQLTQDAQGHLVEATSTAGAADSLAAQLSTQLTNVLALLAAANQTPEAQRSNKHYSLKMIAGPRYWRPNDPVLLLARPGSSAEGLPAGGRNPRATLACPVANLASDNLDAPALLLLQQQALACYQSQQLPTTTWTHNPWQPFLLEWEVELSPASVAGNITNSDRQYSADFITTHYQLDENNPDFSPHEAPDTITDGEAVYSGLSILTPNASIKLAADLNNYLLDWLKVDLPDRYFRQQAVPVADQTYAYLEQHLGDFGQWLAKQNLALTPLPTTADDATLPTALAAWWQANLAALATWYLGRPADTQPTSLIQNLLRCYQQLQNYQCLAQSLGGFNEALLMRKQTRQLEIAEPLGFGEYQDFTSRVRRAVQGRHTTAPQPLNDFMPLRSGHFEVVALRLIDNFGQTVDIKGVNHLITSEPFRDVVHPEKVALRPRLSQAARLNFRWLSAQSATAETTSHPDSSPICGWLLPNYLDNSLNFYDERGQALGILTLNPDAPWQSVPGSPYATTIGQIGNAHLQQVAQYLYNQQLASLNGAGAQPSFLEVFLSTLESALEQIDPENFAQHPDMALLMGRPVAVARVSLDLQLRGKTAEHQGWNIFIKQLQGDTVETDSFDSVEFPVRLGEYQQLNDGLAGYWAETPGEQLKGPFYSPYSPDGASSPVSPAALQARHPSIVTYQVQDGTPLNVSVKVNEPAHTYTLLLDPRGLVHATCGILPTKAIAIPATQYTQALRNIQVTFQVTPLLSEVGKTAISLPVEPGYAWSWLEQTAPAQWRELFREPIITQLVLLEKLPAIAGLWDALTSAGWLVPLADWPGTATIRAKDQRNPATPPAVAQPGVSDPAQVLANIDRVLDAYGQYIQPPATAATFAAQVIREGWLKLRPVPDAVS